VNAICHFVKKYAVEKGWSFYDPLKYEGFMRDMIVRNTTTGEWMVLVIFGSKDDEKISDVLSALIKEHPQITSLHYVINTKRNPTIYDLEIVHFSGKENIMESIGNVNFKISPKSFFQTNTRQAEKLYNIAVDFAALTGNEIVYDLYTGTGTIANYIANRARKAIGIDYIEDSIVNAKENSRINGISNTEFYSGDIKETLNDGFIAAHGKPDVIITDPPRAGMHPDVVKKIAECNAGRIVYVSCNPATQARDIALISDKYRVSRMQPVDMFPYTSHVENVALLEMK